MQTASSRGISFDNIIEHCAVDDMEEQQQQIPQTLKSERIKKRTRQRQRYINDLRHNNTSCCIDDRILDGAMDPICEADKSSSFPCSPVPEGAPTSSNDVPNYFSDVPCGHNCKRYNRNQTMFSLTTMAALLLSFYPAITYANASSSLQYKNFFNGASNALFVPPIITRHPSTTMSIQRKTPQTTQRQKRKIDTTWSNAVRQKSSLEESKFGVRKRVKSVLDKAKKRTGVENSSDTVTTNNAERPSISYIDESLTIKRIKDGYNGDSSSFVKSGLNVVAETASIGGLGESEDDVALDYIPKKGNKYNDTTSSSRESLSTLSGESYEDPAILTKLVEGRRNGVKAAQDERKTASSLSTRTSSVPSPSPSTAAAFNRPEDNFILRNKNDSSSNSSVVDNEEAYVEKDAFTGDVSAAFSLPREPLPFELPELDAEQSRRLKSGERVQYQDDMGRAGSGFVVWDVKAPPSVVWDCLLDFQTYPQTIPTVRDVVMYTNTHLKDDLRAEKPIDYEDGTLAICKHGVPSVTRAQFSLSKFRLKIAAVHKYRPHPKGDYMIFTLDPASTNMVLKYAKGIWYTEGNPDGKEGYTRVWLLCELRVSRLLPQWIVDYAAARAMPRATTWLKPQTEAAAMLWLKDSAEKRR